MPNRLALLLVALGGALVSSGAAQGPPGTNLSVAVIVDRIERSADTARVQYTVRNASDSREGLWIFTVEAPARPLSITVPTGPGRWTVSSNHGTLSVAEWADFGQNIAAGAETPPLSYRARGLPGIVAYYAAGYFPPPPYRPMNLDTMPRLSARDALAANAVRGTTVGIEPFPPDASPGALNERLRSFAARACGLGWINDQGVCHSLQVKLDQAARSLERGDGTGARRQLGAFLEELEAQHGAEPGKHVGDNAYWLLRINVEDLLGRM